MKTKKTIIWLLFFFFALTAASAAVQQSAGQEEASVKLAPRYRAFLAETQMIMSDQEKRVFGSLKTDEEREMFIRRFWQSRGGRQRGVRANINLLRLMRMVQVLELNEEQVSVILPVMNQNEKEKQQLQEDIQAKMRELRVLILKEEPDEEELNTCLTSINKLKKDLLDKEAEFEEFLNGQLSLIQQANYILFSQEFYRGLREELDRARSLREGIRKRTAKR